VDDIKILVVEDDLEINRLVSEHLSREGYTAISAFDGADALLKLSSTSYQMVILDIMMPKADGYEVLQKIRTSGNTPVLILSAKCQETDKIIGLGLGADDYMTKPFGMGELTARIKAQLRRYLKFSNEPDTIDLIKHLDIEMDTSTFEVKTGDKPISLTAKEFEILKLFMLNPRKVFTKSQLFKSIWGEDYINDENTVMVHIRRLREKIEADPSNPKYIQTVWGIGYKLAEELKN
jgi:DNA-binding response OmpR family regulator